MSVSQSCQSLDVEMPVWVLCHNVNENSTDGPATGRQARQVLSGTTRGATVLEPFFFFNNGPHGVAAFGDILLCYYCVAASTLLT